MNTKKFITCISVLIIFAGLAIIICFFYKTHFSPQNTNTENKFNNTNNYNVDNNNDNYFDENTKNNKNSPYDKNFENKEYGITFSYPSTFSKHYDSLSENSVEGFSDDNENQIFITKASNTTMDEEISNQKNKTSPDGKNYNTNIYEIGYITLDTGTYGYSANMMAGGKYTSIFISQKGNDIFTFTFVSGNSDYDSTLELFDNIMNSIYIKE